MALAGPLASVFRWVLRTSAQASVLICLILVVQAVLRRKLAPKWHYALWFLLIARLAMPWTLESGFSLFNLFSFRQQSRTTFVLGEIPTAPTTAPDVVVRVSESEGYATALATVPRRAWNWRRLRRVVLYSEIVPTIWLVGALALAAYGLAESFVLSLRVRREPLLTDRNVLELLEKCRGEIGVRRSPVIVQSPRVDSPSLFGLIRPRLMLPQGMVETLDSRQLRYVLLHELAHLKRRDLAVNWLTTLLQAVHWFNPLIWYAFYRVRADREVACDAHTLSRTNPGESKQYGQTIVHLLERFSQPRRLPTTVGILEDKSQLKRRIIMIARFKKNTYRWSAVAVALLAVLACVALTDAREAPEKDEENTATSETSAEEQAEAARAKKIEAMREKLQTLVELDFDRGTDIRDVLRLVSNSYTVNIVLDDRVVLPPEGMPARRIGGIEPTVESAMPRIYLPRIPLDESLEAILKPAGLAYKVLPEFIWVSTPAVLQTEPLEPVETRFVLPSATDKEKGSLTAKLDKMREVLRNECAADFHRGTDLSNVTDFLANFYDVNIVIDERVMLPPAGAPAQRAGEIKPTIPRESPRMWLGNLPVGEALIGILKPMDLDYRVLPEFVWISTPDVLQTESFASVESRLALPRAEGELTDSVKEKLDNMLAHLSTMVAVDFESGSDISDVLDFLRDFYEVNTVLDERVMLSPDGTATTRAEGMEPTIPRESPRINIKRIPAGDALVAILKPMGLDYRILPEYIWISTSDVLRRETKPLKSVSPGTDRAGRDAAGDIHVPVGVDPAAIRPFTISGTLRKDQEGRLALGDDEPVLRQIERMKKKLEVRGNWDLDVGSDIRQILDSASNSYDLNIVLDTRVMLPTDADAPMKRGALEATAKSELQEAVRLTDAPLGEVLRTVLSQLGLEYRVEPEFLWVSTPYVLTYESYEELETRYFLVDDAKWAVELLAKLRGKAPVVKDLNTGETLSYMDFNEESNLLVIHNIPSNFEIVEEGLK